MRSSSLRMRQIPAEDHVLGIAVECVNLSVDPLQCHCDVKQRTVAARLLLTVTVVTRAEVIEACN